MAAGLGTKLSPTGFLAMKALLALDRLLRRLAARLGPRVRRARARRGLAGAIGFLGARLRADAQGSRPQGEIRADLPDALDLLAVSVEAGLGFDASPGQAQRAHGRPAGRGIRADAVRDAHRREPLGGAEALSERVDAPELSAFTRAIIQADQLGTSLGRILRVQATDARLRRQAAAEERAMKAPIKMLFPTVLFIFPAMFLVILGPAILNVQQLFG